MSKNIGTPPPHAPSDEPEGTINLRQCFLVVGISGALVTAILASYALKGKGEHTTPPLTPSQNDLQEVLIHNVPTLGELPVIRSGNLDEITILKASGKDGYYIFHKDGVVTYWRMQSGNLVESDTFTLTW